MPDTKHDTRRPDTADEATAQMPPITTFNPNSPAAQIGATEGRNAATSTFGGIFQVPVQTPQPLTPEPPEDPAAILEEVRHVQRLRNQVRAHVYAAFDVIHADLARGDLRAREHLQGARAAADRLEQFLMLVVLRMTQTEDAAAVAAALADAPAMELDIWRAHRDQERQQSQQAAA